VPSEVSDLLWKLGLVALALAAWPWIQRWISQRLGSTQKRPTSQGFDLSPLDGLFSELEFRTLTAADVPAFQALVTDPETLATNRWTAETIDNQRRTIENPDSFPMFANHTLLGVEKASSLVIGAATLGQSRKDEFTIGLMIDAASRGRGYGRQLLAAMILTTQHNIISPIAVLTDRENERVRRIMSRLGYEPDDEPRLVEFPDGTSIEALRYECGAGTSPPHLD